MNYYFACSIYFHISLANICVHACSVVVWLFVDSTDSSPSGSSLHGISQSRILQWVAITSSRGIFPTQESNPFPESPASQVDSLPLSHMGSQQIYNNVYISICVIFWDILLLLLPSEFKNIKPWLGFPLKNQLLF